MKLLFLIGMPGSGKSHWAKEIARHYAIDCIDMDKLIEYKAGMDIPAIFVNHGEAYFREIEHGILKDIIENTVQDTVVACGGGAPCYHNGMELMKQAGTVIYLETGIEALQQRLAPEISHRPLLQQHPDTAKYLADTLYKRKSIYEQANHILPSENISLTTFAEILTSCIKRH